MKLTYGMITALAIVTTSSLLADDSHKHHETGGGEVTKTEEVKPYTPTTCMVSGEKLGEMGKPVVFVYQGQEIKLCCKSCRKDFDKDPAKYLKKLSEAK